MTLPRQNPFSKKVTDLPDSPSPAYSASEIKEYFQTPADELSVTLNLLSDELVAGTAASKVGAKDGESDSTIQGVLDKLEGESNSLSARMTSVENKNTTQDSSITDLDNRVEWLEQSDAGNSGDIQWLKTRMTANEALDNDHEERITEMESDNSIQNSQISSLSTRMTAAESVNSGQGTDISNLKVRMDSAETTNNSQDSRINAIVGQSGSSNTEIVDARLGFPILRDKLQSIDASLAEKATKGEIVSSDFKTTTDNDRLGLSNLKQEVILAITGNTPVNSIPADKSVTPAKTSFLSEKHYNLFDKSTVVVGALGSSDGSVVVLAGYSTSDYIPAKPNTLYVATEQHTWAFYNTNKTFISAQTVSTTATSPANTAYIRKSFSDAHLSVAMISESALPSSYYPYSYYEINASNEFKTLISNINGLNRWAGKKWSAVGDSITEKNGTATLNYTDYLKQWIGCTLNNYGHSGTGYMTDYNGKSRIYNRLSDIATDSDIITIFAGTNDNSATIGNFGDTDQTATFYGALDYTFKTLTTNFFNKQIAVITPIPRWDNYGESANSLKVRVDAIIKVANHYGIPVLDLYRASSFRVWDNNFKTYAIPDGVHPNDAGHLMIAHRIYSFINSI